MLLNYDDEDITLSLEVVWWRNHRVNDADLMNNSSIRGSSIDEVKDTQCFGHYGR